MKWTAHHVSGRKNRYRISRNRLSAAAAAAVFTPALCHAQTYLYGAQSVTASVLDPSGTNVIWVDTGTSADGDFTFSNSANYTITHQFTVQNNRNFTGDGAFTDNGTFTKNDSTGTTAFNIPFNCGGAVLAQSGTIQFTAGGSDAYPTYNAASGGTVDFHAGNWTNTQNAGTIFSGTGGIISITGATYNADGVSIAPQVGSSVTTVVNGGTLSAGGLYIGSNGNFGTGGVGKLIVQSGNVSNLVYSTQVGNGSINVSGGSVTLGSLYIDTNPATFQQSVFSGGNTTFNTYSSNGDGLLLGNSASTEGNIRITGNASVQSVGGEVIGFYGNGTVVQDGGTHASEIQTIIGGEGGSNGTYNLSGGRLDAYDAGMTVGYFGNGTFNQTGSSTVEVHGDLHVGDEAGSTGIYVLNSGSLLVDNTEYIAPAFSTDHTGSGTFIQNGGTNTVSNGMWIGQQTSGTGTYNMSGGSLTVSNGTTIGPAGVFNQLGGHVNLNGDLTTSGGYADLDVAGTYNLENNAVLNINHYEYVYSTGATPALVNQTGGTHNVSGYLITGRYSGTSGNFIISNSTLSALNVYVAGDNVSAGGTSTFTINSGGVVNVGQDGSGNFTGDVHIWPGGTFVVNTGGVLNTGTFENDGTVFEAGGTFNIAAGSIVTGAGGTITVGSPPPSSIRTPGILPVLTAGANTTFNGNSVTIAGGALTAVNNLMLASANGSTATLTISGNSSANITGTLGAGNSGTITSAPGTSNGAAIVNATGNSTTYADTILLGSTNGGSGALNISQNATVTVGGGLQANDATLTGGSLQVLNQNPPAGEDPELNRSIVGGYLRNGQLNVNGGTVISPNIKLGITSGMTGTYTQTAGAVSVISTFAVGSDVSSSNGSGIGIASFSGGTAAIHKLLVGSTAGGVGTVNIGGSAAVTADAVTVNPGSSLNISGGSLQITTHGSNFSANVIAAAAITATGKLDITNNALVLQNPDMSTLQSLVVEGLGNGHWNGDGITSSAAASDTTDLTAVALIRNNNGHGVPIWGLTSPPDPKRLSFDGQTPDVNDALVKYTYYGDTDLDGVVDGSDYSRVDNGYLQQLTGWLNGDFNYDGVVNGSDYTLIDNAFNEQGTSLESEFAVTTSEVSGQVSAVPEPASLGAIGLVAIAMLGRRRKRSAARFSVAD